MTISIAAFVGAGFIFAVLRPRQGLTTVLTVEPIDIDMPCAVFLFQGKELVDATGEALALMNHTTNHLSDYDAMLNALALKFPTLAQTLDDPLTSDIRLRSNEDPAIYVDIHREDTQLRVTLHAAESTAARQWVQAAQDAETSLLHDVAAHSTQLIWQTDKAGKLLWANQAYCTFAAQQDTEDSPLFLLKSANDDTGAPPEQRVSIKSTISDLDQWFDVRTVARADGFLHFANDANALVRVDHQRQSFVKTLGKTFAQLAIGLAIFDRDRQLVMFNPAMHEMTQLPVDFLVGKPSIDTVLDRLREQRMLPEPKNYGSWRDQFTAVETAAKNGTYSEHWSLPDGQTYRVTGRPHPDGAFAFLFEDISAEVSLTRRFRSDIETGQAVLDTLPDAIAVFSAAGTLVTTNQAYAKLWSTNPELMLEHRELQAEMSIWQDHCIPSPMWSEMRNFIQQLGARKPWTENAMLDDGRHLRCYASHITGGMTMVRFSIASQMRPVIRKLTLPDPIMHVGKR